MSEAILKALMQLFVLIGDIHDDSVITAREKNIVRLFLVRHLNNEQVEKYMKMFGEYLGTFHSEKIVKGSIQDRKRVSLNAMRILSICEKINEELQQKQKIYVLVKLVEYISTGSEITETELDFLQTVATAFNIPYDEYSDIRNFIMNPGTDLFNHERVLIIDGKKENGREKIRHVFNENLRGTIMFLHIPGTNTWIMRYSGDEDLYLNGQKIREGEVYIFDQGSSIRGAGIRAIYYSEAVGWLTETLHSAGVTLNAAGVSFRFRKSDNGVHDLNFSGRSGELVGIMGGSGVGKSTTLSILSGTLRPQKGSVLINGYDLYNEDDREKLTGVIGFVPQDDLLIEELTVYQNLYYNAKMCLSNLADEKLEEVVNKMLTGLDLAEARDLRVGNPLAKVISGGQRKRINIALELMREPTILFVDEPTSGLSSVDSEMVMSLLKDLTYKGKLVIINIHQPSSEIYKMFDKLMIIDRGGYPVFYGNPSEAIVYFRVQSNYANPDEDQCVKCGNVDAEQVLRIIEAKVVNEHGKATRIRKISPAEWSARFREFLSPESDKQVKAGKQPLPPNNYSIPGLFRQTVIFFTRDFLSKLGDRQYILISLLGPPLLAFVLAWFIKAPGGPEYVFYENENLPAYIFICVITSMFFGLMGSSEEIVNDRKILKRESFLNLSWFSYLNSKITIMFILSAFQALTFALIGNLILEIRGMTPAYWLVMFTTSCFGNILGLNLSSAFKSVLTIYILIPFIIIPQLLFSGVLVKFDKLNIKQHEYVPVIGDLMIARWSYEALAIQQFRNNTYEKLFFAYDADFSSNDWYANYLIQELKNMVQYNRLFINDENRKEIVLSNWRKLDGHIGDLSELTGNEIPASLELSLSERKLDSVSSSQLIRFLDSMRMQFIAERNTAKNLKDSLIKQLQSSRGGSWLTELKEKFDNKKLRFLVLSIDEKDKIIENDEYLIRKLDPGFMKAASPYGRAHFFAPVKLLGKLEIDTFLFNLTVIWGITLLMYIALYFRLPERIIESFRNMSLKRRE